MNCITKIFLIFQIFFYLIINSVVQSQGFFKEPQCEFKVNCNLPRCNCETTDLNIDFSKYYKKDDIPQLVILTIDDDKLDIKSYQVYKKLLENFKNPNSCSIKATFFLSDSYNLTSYCLARSLYELNHEIAISTVNYTCPHRFCTADRNFRPWKYDVWTDQILNMRERLHRYSAIPKADIVGFRAPLLEPASDMHYRIIYGNKFLYDSSVVMSDNKRITWPYTLDYPIKSPINNNGPLDKYSGLWELSLPTYFDLDNEPLTCLKIWESHCNIDKSVKGIAKFLRHQFLRTYYYNRAPIVMHLNGEWLKEYSIVNETELLPNVGFGDIKKRKLSIEKKEYRNLDGLIKFINETLEYNKDVYFVTARQAIEWMKFLPKLEQENLNLTNLIETQLLDCGEKEEFDGKCEILEQHAPDFDDTQSIYLDDDFGNSMDEKFSKKLKDSILVIELQSEVLFLNKFIFLFLFFLVIAIIAIIFYDKFN